jgi:hypothetical protein
LSLSSDKKLVSKLAFRIQLVPLHRGALNVASYHALEAQGIGGFGGFGGGVKKKLPAAGAAAAAGAGAGMGRAARMGKQSEDGAGGAAGAPAWATGFSNLAFADTAAADSGGGARPILEVCLAGVAAAGAVAGVAAGAGDVHYVGGGDVALGVNKLDTCAVVVHVSRGEGGGGGGGGEGGGGSGGGEGGSGSGGESGSGAEHHQQQPSSSSPSSSSRGPLARRWRVFRREDAPALARWLALHKPDAFPGVTNPNAAAAAAAAAAANAAGGISSPATKAAKAKALAAAKTAKAAARAAAARAAAALTQAAVDVALHRRAFALSPAELSRLRADTGVMPWTVDQHEVGLYKLSSVDRKRLVSTVETIK